MKYYECYETTNHLLILLEYMEGGTLHNKLAKLKKFSENDAAIIL